MQTSFMRRKGAPNTMLIVDDDEMNRVLLSMIFEKDHPILEAANGEEALAIFAEHKGEICAILLDVQMPVMDGITMLGKLAGEHVPARIPIFLITGETKSEVIQQAYDLGVMDVIPKPFAPPIVQRRVNSVMELFAARNHFADVVAEQTEELREQNQQLQNLNMGMIEALATATEFRSGESGEHVRRIHDITRLFLEKTPLRAQFSDEEIRQIALAAILHDVGKISIPDAILNKPGRLTPEEFAVMQQHTVSGDDMLTHIPQLKGLPFYDYARLIARHHHERWDGKGYPDGLAGDDIPIYAQIVGVADVYDALVSQRVYKPPFEHGDAVDMIINGRCGVFNPLLMEYFRDCAPAMRELYARRAD
ncbi:HD domain-containing phosphohydrolase [Desulfovibrio sp.]|uniref:HD-GYP domain-containing protein n=1 Tax=Desulfovibrio sp. TaxID=885 RepID=UPI0023C860E1|nr:HD domain-containing phosphohydrolase [Desulfovibrio sp.]MDE7242121.1 response regulator [Desulfovibrio sp.]